MTATHGLMPVFKIHVRIAGISSANQATKAYIVRFVFPRVGSYNHLLIIALFQKGFLFRILCKNIVEIASHKHVILLNCSLLF